MVFEQRIGDAHTLRAMGYMGNRKVVQYLAIPAATQANPLNSGGVVDLGHATIAARTCAGPGRESWPDRAARTHLGGKLRPAGPAAARLQNFWLGAHDTRRARQPATRRDQHASPMPISSRSSVWQFAAALVGAGRRALQQRRFRIDRSLHRGHQPRRQRQPQIRRHHARGGRDVPSHRIAASVCLDGRRLRNAHIQRTVLSRRRPARAWHSTCGPRSATTTRLGAKWRTAGGRADRCRPVPREHRGRPGCRAQHGRPQQLPQCRQCSRARVRDVGCGCRWAANWRCRRASYTWIDATFRTRYRICASQAAPHPMSPCPPARRIPGVPEHMGQLALQ